MNQFAGAFNKVARYFDDVAPVIERTQIGYVVIRPNSDPNWSDPVEYTAKFPDLSGKIASKDNKSPVSSDDFKTLYRGFISEFNVWVFKTGEGVITEFIKSLFTYKKLGAEWWLLKEIPHSADMYMVDMFTPTIAQLIEAEMMDEAALMCAFIECKGWIIDLLRPELADIFTDAVTPSGIATYRHDLQNDLLNRPTPPAASMSDTPDPISGTSANPIPDELQTPKAQDLLQRANDAGLCTGRTWNGSMSQLALFAEMAKEEFGFNNKWKHFEDYFNVKYLAQTRRKSIEEEGKVKGDEVVHALFPNADPKRRK